MTRLTPIPVHNLRVFRTIRSGKCACCAGKRGEVA
jgi:hypothetical protein